MFREKYFLDNEMIKPDEQLLASLKIQMKAYAKTYEYLNETMIEESNPRKASYNLRPFIKYSSFAACFLLLLISIATLGSQQGSKKDTASVVEERTGAEATAESSMDMGVAEYSTASANDSNALLDSTNKKAKVTEDESTFGMEPASPTSFIDGKITIAIDTVNTVLISSNTDDTTMQTITDKIILTDLINCLNESTLTPVNKTPSIDTLKERTITIQYNTGTGDDIIHLYNQFLKFNDSEWYELNETALNNLNSLIG